MSGNMLLEQIIRGCIQANRDSQKQLYKLYYGYAMAICMRYSSNYMQAEEIVNDGFLKIYKKIDSFIPIHQHLEGSFTGWMKKIFVNTSIDHYRKDTKNYTIPILEDQEIIIHEHAVNPIDYLSYKEILELVQKLSPAYRAVFNLYVLDGYKHEEIAETLHISVGTSKSNLAKARMNIQKMLQQTNVKLYEQRRAI